jgi:excisionase family DNA binding protein
MEKKPWLNTREIAEFLDVNEKVVYSLVAEKGLPATKVTGKWLFPRHLVEQWLESQTLNYPKTLTPPSGQESLLITSGSNDILFDKGIDLYNRLNPGHPAVFGNLGSLGGLRSLRRKLARIASSHLLEENEKDYNFGFALDELGELPAIVNFCRREQGLILQKSNPKGIKGVEDLVRPGVKVVNRPLGTGTRLLFDTRLRNHGLEGDRIEGYQVEVTRHLDVGHEVLAGRADAGPGIRAVAGLVGLDFLSWGWERFDLVILKDSFFDEDVQRFLGLLREPEFLHLAAGLEGYDLSLCGKMIFPGGAGIEEEKNRGS